MTASQTSVTVGDRLPDVTLARVDDGSAVDLRGSVRDAAVVVFTHPDCDACDEYVAALASGIDDLGDWNAVLRVLSARRAPAAPEDLAVVEDEDGALRRRLGLDPDVAAVVVADRFGEVWEVTTDEDGHDLPGPEQVESWARFLATQCPECGVPDRPDTGGWVVW
ncbi:MAG: hypothetical protein KY462_03535 [Actinobacteria bacterium]|nr:hypothetical protein [Actinomycetota bacterium]